MKIKWPNCNRASVLCVCLLLTACQTVPSTESVEADATPLVQPTQVMGSSYQPRTPAGLVLMAERALAENRTERAVTLYLQAAEQSEQSEVAERAAFLARQVGAPSQSARALTRWRQLDPNNQSALEASLIYAVEHGTAIEAQQSLGRLLTLDPDYQVHWIASFWASVDATKQTALTPRFQNLAELTGNGSLALVVTEIKNRNQPESGTAWLDQWMETHPAIPEVVLFRARLDLPDRTQAIARLNRFPEVLDDANVQSQQARWSGLVGDAVQARVLLRAALKTDPDRHQDRLTLALLEMQADRLEDAEMHLKTLLATERFRANAYYHLGELAKTKQEFDLAIDRFLRVDRGELIVEARKQLASLALTQEQPDQAIRWFDEARLLFPGLRPQLTLAEAQFQTTNGMAQDAIPVLSQALADDPDRRDVLYTRALAYEQMGDIPNAEADLRRILASDPEDADALNALGYTLADRTDRYDEALVLIEKALQKQPESPAILDSMGWVLFKLGRLEEALPYFERAWAIVQDHEIAAHYGEVLWSLGRTLEAQGIWELGYQSNPESDKIRSTIERLTNS